tara:strand:- start:565 stop:768 length:204 start_codon:yes stop_codon:yes gene_type:complete
MEDNMQTKYSKKIMGKSTTKAPTKDGDIWQDGAIWKFKWKGSECGYGTEKAAKDGLKQLSGASKEKA